ncbi:MAG TPA: DNA starvation/stationary phase protection protein Dps [Pyrinomonadaceae bacterium]|nr:DNA starvation/stationary phase protection protein Dps [Pyrinomonadaceae bacterium]
MELHETKIDLAKGKREKLVGILNQSLADSIDLVYQAKQAHWNVKGPNFIALHELFDRVATELDTHVDDLAERITTLGGIAMGTVRLSAENSSLAEYPHEISDGTAHVDALSTALSDFGKKARKNIDATDEIGDKDTADLYTGISRNVDKLLWFVEAHNQA